MEGVMYQGNEERLQELLEEQASIFGMISEVKMKARLLKQRTRHEESFDSSPSFGLQTAVEEDCARMFDDLAKYRERLEQIDEEMQIYGPISEMDGDEGVFWPESGL